MRSFVYMGTGSQVLGWCVNPAHFPLNNGVHGHGGAHMNKSWTITSGSTVTVDSQDLNGLFVVGKLLQSNFTEE